MLRWTRTAQRRQAVNQVVRLGPGSPGRAAQGGQRFRPAGPQPTGRNPSNAQAHHCRCGRCGHCRHPDPALTVQIVSLPPTGQGNLVTATVRTAPAADCAIDVEYKSGPATAAGLDQKTASGSGIVRWTWKVGTRTTPGDWPVTVTCAYRAASESDQRPLTVLDTGKAG